jgi:SAM-dependent methyltransferase
MHQGDVEPTDAGGWAEGRGWGWETDEEYAQVFFRRATGDLPEMESSKALATLLKPRVQSGDAILDVGCGAGHYLRSLRGALPMPFTYSGVDSCSLYIKLAGEAFSSDPDASFDEADIFDLPFPTRSFDVTACNNVLLHLPTIETPLKELCRVTRRLLVIRTLVGERSFLIKEVRGSENEFDASGEPTNFNHYNIYGASLLRSFLEPLPTVRSVEILPDRDFDPSLIEEAARSYSNSENPTRIFDGWQVNGYVLQPWAFVIVELAEE